MHPCFPLPHVFGAPVHSPFTFRQFSSFFPWLGGCFGNSQWLGSFLDVFVVVSSLLGWGKPIFGCTMNGRRDPQYLGVYWGCFSHVKPINIYANQIAIKGLFYPSSIFVFGSQDIFLNPRTCIFVCVHPVFWSELVWSGRGNNELDKTRVERNHKERSRGAGYSLLHTLKITQREGIAWGIV